MLSCQVTFDGPSDPENPQNWTLRRRRSIIIVLNILSFFGTFATYMVTPALGEIARAVHVRSKVERQLIFSISFLGYLVKNIALKPISNRYSRFPILCTLNMVFFAFNLACGFSENTVSLILFRFFSGLGGSSAARMSHFIFMDMSKNDESWQPAASMLNLTQIFATLVGPILSAWVTEKLSWSWIFKCTSIGYSVPLVASALLLKESHHRVILSRKAEKLRRRTSNRFLHSEILPPVQLLNSLHLAWRNVLSIDTSPFVLLLMIYNCLMMGVWTLIFSIIPRAFKVNYHESVGVSSLNYVSIHMGNFIGMILWSMYERLGRVATEPLLVLTMIFSFGLTAGLCTYG